MSPNVLQCRLFEIGLSIVIEIDDEHIHTSHVGKKVMLSVGSSSIITATAANFQSFQFPNFPTKCSHCHFTLSNNFIFIAWHAQMKCFHCRNVSLFSV